MDDDCLLWVEENERGIIGIVRLDVLLWYLEHNNSDDMNHLPILDWIKHDPFAVTWKLFRITSYSGGELLFVNDFCILFVIRSYLNRHEDRVWYDDKVVVKRWVE
jgi:hypothetical protein